LSFRRRLGELVAGGQGAPISVDAAEAAALGHLDGAAITEKRSADTPSRRIVSPHQRQPSRPRTA